MIPQPAKQQPNVVGEHSRESSRYGMATHGERAHTFRGRRGSPRHRPRQLRLAQRLAPCRARTPVPERLSWSLGAARSCMPQRLRPWPAQTTADRCASAGRSVRLTRTHRKRSRTTTAGGVAARSISIDLPKVNPRFHTRWTPPNPLRCACGVDPALIAEGWIWLGGASQTTCTARSAGGDSGLVT